MAGTSVRTRARLAGLGVVALVLTIGGCGTSTVAIHRNQPTSTTVHVRAPRRVDVADARFVSTSGNDTNPGTVNAPWRTIAYALSRLRPGNTLYVHGGFYLERVKLAVTAGRPRAPIVVRPFGNERPLIVGQLWLGEASYWTISGINVAWSAIDPDEPMVRMFGGTHWVYRDSIIVGAHSTSDLHVDDGPHNDLAIGRWWGTASRTRYPRTVPTKTTTCTSTT